MLKFLPIALILTLSLTGCGAQGRIETQKDIAAACPAVKVYSVQKQCTARAEVKKMISLGIAFPVVQEMLVDGKVLRDQSRVCRGLPIPAAKKPVCK